VKLVDDNFETTVKLLLFSACRRPSFLSWHKNEAKSSRLLLILHLRYHKTQVRTGDLLDPSELPALTKVLFQLRATTKRGRPVMRRQLHRSLASASEPENKWCRR